VKKPNTIEDEIDRIRLKIYEETKHMTDAEYVAYIRKSAEEGVARCGFKLVPSTRHKGCFMLISKNKEMKENALRKYTTSRRKNVKLPDKDIAAAVCAVRY